MLTIHTNGPSDRPSNACMQQNKQPKPRLQTAVFNSKGKTMPTCIMDAWMKPSASSASACLTFSSALCLSASLLSWSTVFSASASLDRPPFKNLVWSET